MRLGPGLALTLLTTALPSLALASPVNARISQSGLDFARDRVIEMVPARIDLPAVKVDMWECTGEPASFELQEGAVEVEVHGFNLTLPSHGTIRATLDVTVDATGKAHFEKLYACYGRETCDARISARHARLLVDLKPSVDSAGKPHVVIEKLDVQLEPSDVDIALSSCPADDIVNLIVGFVKQYGLKLGLLIGQQIAQNEIGPVVEGLVAGFLTYQGAGPALASIPQLEFKAALTGIDITPSGLTVSGDLDLLSRFPAAACLDSDPGEPRVFPGPAPDLGAGLATDIGLSVNLGLVQDALYHVWRDGMMCVTPHTLEGFGIDLEALDHVGDMLPGFPEGTKFTFEASVREPPRVEGNIATSAKLTIHVGKMEAMLLATLPDGSPRRLTLDLDASVSASIVMDPRINALALQVDGVKLDRMGVDDQLGLTELGFDFGKIQQLLETVILPDVLGQVGQIPVTGPVFGGIEGVPIYVLVKELKTTPAYVAVKANLFKAPADDREAPTTSVDQKPARVVRPDEAKLVFGGMDRQIPTELLRYRVFVDGVSQGEPTFVRLLKVGEAGKSQKVRVKVHALDLAGNEDRAGVTVEVDVDGVLPQLALVNQLRGTVDDLTPTMKWTASDDRTSADRIAAHLTVTQIPARASDGAEIEVSSGDLAAGSTETTLEGLQAGKQYRAVLTVKDEAGNAAVATSIFTVSADAAGGCAVGGSPASGLASLLLVGLALLAFRRRA
jgi:hypothetical protein